MRRAPGRRRSRAGGGAARRRRAHAAQLRSPAADRSRLSARWPADRARRALRRALPRSGARRRFLPAGVRTPRAHSPASSGPPALAPSSSPRRRTPRTSASRGGPSFPRTNAWRCPWTRSTPDYFRVMDIPLRRGRFFDERDAAGAAPTVIINETMARRFWRDEDPLGRRIKYGTLASQGPWMTIVGVVADTRRTGYDAEVRPETYLPHAQSPDGGLDAGRSGRPATRRRPRRLCDRSCAISIPRSRCRAYSRSRRSWSR